MNIQIFVFVNSNFKCTVSIFKEIFEYELLKFKFFWLSAVPNSAKILLSAALICFVPDSAVSVKMWISLWMRKSMVHWLYTEWQYPKRHKQNDIKLNYIYPIAKLSWTT